MVGETSDEDIGIVGSVKVMFTMVVDIQPIAKSDVPLLERLFPQGVEKHSERFLRQGNEDVVYLVAWRQGQPVGHVLLKWGGSQDDHVRGQLSVACPDIEDLFVLDELRSQGIGRQLLDFAELLVRERGYTYVGLSVDATPGAPARRLYERQGYRDAQFGEYTERGEYLDSAGRRHTWEERCLYLIKDLRLEGVL